MSLDFFDLTGLPFDSSDQTAKKVKVAIDKKLNQLGALLGSETQAVKRDEITEQIKLLNDIKTIILSPDGRSLVKSEYASLADKRLQSELSKLTATAKLMARTGNLEITEATIKSFRKEFKLPEDRVVDIFLSLGFKIVKYDTIDVSKLFPKQIKEIDEHISALRKTKDPNPNGLDTAFVTDLYAFAAYLVEEPENAPLYRGKKAADLLPIFDTAAKKYSQSNDNLGKLCASLSTSAKTYVFNSDENRQAYELYLKYKTPRLQDLFASMRGTPEQMLLTDTFAKLCIEEISEVLGCSYEVSLAIYNKEAGVTYIPAKAVYHIKCNSCGVVNEYSSEAEAVKKNTCANCNKALYKKCPKCGKMTPVANEKCPSPCGYVFAGAASFEKYFHLAEEALRESDFELARKHLFDAQSADPSQDQRMKQLSEKISKQERIYQAPINELRKLISAGQFYSAKTALSKIVKEHPDISVSAFEEQISSALSAADKKFSASQHLPPSKQADACIAILHDCTDHLPALNFLRVTPPLQCKHVSVVPDSTKGVIYISWANSQEQGIRYCLVRKNGKKVPISLLDGQLLLDDPVATSFCDRTAEPGQTYTYALFISRVKVLSAAIWQTAVIYPDVQNLRIVQNRDVVRLTWDSPKNSLGATVSRRVSGRDSVLTSAAHESYEDANVQYGVAYSYTVSANYSDSTSSPGIECVITPLLIIDSFKIKLTQVKDNVYSVSWSICQPDVSLRILVNQALMNECKSGVGAVQIPLPKENLCAVIVMAYSGGQWISSENYVQVNTYSPCSIDKDKTELREETINTPQGSIFSIDLRIRLTEDIPSNVVGFYYAVRTVADSSRWATVAEIGRTPDICRVTVKDYRIKNEIIYTNSVRDEKTLFISVFTVYVVNGKEVVSEPKKMKVDRVVSADLFWKITKSLFGAARLTILIEGNRPLEHIPELVLCVCNDGEFITAHNDPKAVELLKVPPIDLDEAQSKYTQSYELDKLSNLKGMKCFLFEINPIRSERFTIRWFQGFSGKVR